ncbi:MAG: prolipoprotein diacylglyceryl transferase [Myxococcales bacterium]|nr:prolipoprotein diacylglyceryl transferase [Myxococcales bacterium]
MRPIMFRFGDLALHSYGVFLAIGFLYGITLATKEARRLGQDPEKMLDLSFWVLIGAIAGARLFHCMVYWEDYIHQPLEILKIWKGGLTFYGGFILAMLFVIAFIWRYKLPALTWMDAMSPALMLGITFGRMGCFNAGCCYGKPTSVPWGVVFNQSQGLATKGIALHPTQLYQGLANFSIFLIIMGMRKHKRFEGQPFYLTIVLYSILRSFIEIFRADPRGFVHVFGMPVSESQLVSAIIGPLALIALVYQTWKHRKGAEPLEAQTA